MRSRKALPWVVFAVFLLSGSWTPASAGATTVYGRIVSIADGDTVTLLDADKRQHKIRLSGIDAPDMQVPSKKS